MIITIHAIYVLTNVGSIWSKRTILVLSELETSRRIVWLFTSDWEVPGAGVFVGGVKPWATCLCLTSRLFLMNCEPVGHSGHLYGKSRVCTLPSCTSLLLFDENFLSQNLQLNFFRPWCTVAMWSFSLRSLLSTLPHKSHRGLTLTMGLPRGSILCLSFMWFFNHC